MIVAIITARGGSKGLPGKNIKILSGHPLIAYSIKAAQDSGIFSRIIVSTDCEDIAKVSEDYGAEILMRPHDLAQDHSSSYDVVAHVLEVIASDDEYDNFMLLQPTSPLRTSEHITDSYKAFKENDYQSLVSISEMENTPFKCFVEDKDDLSIKPLFGWDELTMPRQQLPKTYLINGAIYISNILSFFDNKSFFSEKLGCFKMDSISSIDIDSIEDFSLAEKNMLANI